MAVIPASAQITAISFFNLAMAFFLLTNPERLSTYTFTTILSVAFNLPYKPPSFSEPSAMSALLAVLLAYVSISDLVSANLPEEIFFYHWSAQAPVRAFFFFLLTIVSFLTTEEGVGKIAKVLAGGQSKMLTPTGPGRLEGGLGNGLVFVFGFVMVMWWFWIYVTVSDERREMATKKQAKRA